ncbi:MAG TPA: hypothetical protein VGE74_01850 [Gemmata sp.]
MRWTVLAVVTCVLVGGLIAPAQDEKAVRPAQPAQPKVIQPLPARPLTVTAAKMAQLEEEAEVLEAQREVKKAHIKAAEIRVEATNQRYELLNKAAKGTREDHDAKYEFDMAKAQLEIRIAELKETEVKVKFARKRLEDAKAAGVRPVPNPRPVAPKAVDPPPINQ